MATDHGYFDDRCDVGPAEWKILEKAPPRANEEGGLVTRTNVNFRAYRTRWPTTEKWKPGMHTILKKICDEYELVLLREAPHDDTAFVTWDIYERKSDSNPIIRVDLRRNTGRNVFTIDVRQDVQGFKKLAHRIESEYRKTNRYANNVLTGGVVTY